MNMQTKRRSVGTDTVLENSTMLAENLTSRKQLMEQMLDRIFYKVNVKAQVTHTRQRTSGHGALCSDGWRKRAGDQGLPLVNFMMLLQTDSALLRVLRAAGALGPLH